MEGINEIFAKNLNNLILSLLILFTSIFIIIDIWHNIIISIKEATLNEVNGENAISLWPENALLS